MRWFTHSFALPVRIFNFIYDQTKNDLNDLRRMKLIPKNCFNCRDWVCVFTRTQHTLMRCAYNKRREFMWITIKIRILFVNLNFMAIFCIAMNFSLSKECREKSLLFSFFFLFSCLFYCSRRAKNGKDMNYFWLIYCQFCAYTGHTSRLSSLFSLD